MAAVDISMVGTQYMENENYLTMQQLYFWMYIPKKTEFQRVVCLPLFVSIKCGSKLLLIKEGMKI